MNNKNEADGWKIHANITKYLKFPEKTTKKVTKIVNLRGN
jgi:hypothetical protein